MTVRELVTKFGLGLDRSSFDAADQRVERLKKAALAVGAAFAGNKIVSWARRMVDETAQAGDQLGIMAARTGVGVEALQEIQHAAQITGASTNDAYMALAKLGKKVAEAGAGNKTTAATFRALGVSIRDGSGKLRSTEDVFTDLADGIARIPSDAKRTQVAMQLMEEGGLKLVPMLAQGSAGLAAMRQEARDLGVMTEDTAKAAGDMVVNQIRLRRALTGLRDQIVGRLLPAMNETIPKLLAWMKANKELLAQHVERAVRAITGAMAVLANLGGFIADITRRIASAFGDTAAAGFKLALIVTALVALFGLKAVAIGLIVALTEDFIGFLQGKDSIIGRIVDRMRELRQEFTKRDLSWKEHPYLKFLQAVVKAWDNLTDRFERLPPPLKSFVTTALPMLAPLILPKTFENRQRSNQAPRELAANEERMAKLRADLGLPSYDQVGATAATRGVLMSPQIHQELNLSIDASGLTKEEAEAVVESAVTKANRQAFTAMTPAIAGSGW